MAKTQPVAFSIPNDYDIKTIGITEFKGLNVTDNSFKADLSEPSDMLNLWKSETGVLTTRPRVALSKSFINATGTVWNIYNVKNLTYYHVGNKLFKDNGTIHSITNSASTGFVDGMYLYIIDGDSYFRINATSDVKELSSSFGKVPTYRYGLSSGDNSGIGVYEDYNILNSKYRNSYFYTEADANSLNWLKVPDINKLVTESTLTIQKSNQIGTVVSDYNSILEVGDMLFSIDVIAGEYFLNIKQGTTRYQKTIVTGAPTSPVRMCYSTYRNLLYIIYDETSLYTYDPFTDAGLLANLGDPRALTYPINNIIAYKDHLYGSGVDYLVRISDYDETKYDITTTTTKSLNNMFVINNKILCLNTEDEIITGGTFDILSLAWLTSEGDDTFTSGHKVSSNFLLYKNGVYFIDDSNNLEVITIATTPFDVSASSITLLAEPNIAEGSILLGSFGDDIICFYTTDNAQSYYALYDYTTHTVHTSPITFYGDMSVYSVLSIIETYNLDNPIVMYSNETNDYYFRWDTQTLYISTDHFINTTTKTFEVETGINGYINFITTINGELCIGGGTLTRADMEACKITNGVHTGHAWIATSDDNFSTENIRYITYTGGGGDGIFAGSAQSIIYFDSNYWLNIYNAGFNIEAIQNYHGSIIDEYPATTYKSVGSTAGSIGNGVLAANDDSIISGTEVNLYIWPISGSTWTTLNIYDTIECFPLETYYTVQTTVPNSYYNIVKTSGTYGPSAELHWTDIEGHPYPSITTVTPGKIVYTNETFFLDFWGGAEGYHWLYKSTDNLHTLVDCGIEFSNLPEEGSTSETWHYLRSLSTRGNILSLGTGNKILNIANTSYGIPIFFGLNEDTPSIINTSGIEYVTYFEPYIKTKLLFISDDAEVVTDYKTTLDIGQNDTFLVEWVRPLYGYDAIAPMFYTEHYRTGTPVESFELITEKFFNKYNLCNDSTHYYSANEDPTYFPLRNSNLFQDTITGLNTLSDSIICITTKDRLFFGYTNSITISNESIETIVITEAGSKSGHYLNYNTNTTPISEIPIIVNKTGLYGLQLVENVQSSERIPVLLTENISQRFTEDITANSFLLRGYNYFYVFIPGTANTIIYALDCRTFSWYYWEIPHVISCAWMEDKTIYFGTTAGVICELTSLDREITTICNRYDDWIQDNKYESVEWYWTSQITPLNSLLYYKQLVSVGFIINDTDAKDQFSLSYQFNVFKKDRRESSIETVKQTITYIKSVFKRAYIPRFDFIQMKISSTSQDEEYNTKLNLMGLLIKYKLTGGK